MQGIHKWVLPVLVILTLPVWFYHYPFSPSGDMPAIVLDGVYLGLFLVGYLLIASLDAPVIVILWSVFAYILFLFFIDDVSSASPLKASLEILLNTDIEYLKKSIQILGILTVLTCFYIYLSKSKFENLRLKQIEKKSREIEERYSLISNNSAELIQVLDNGGNILYASPSHLEILGYTPLELQGRNISNIVSPEDRDRLLEALSNQNAEEERTLEFNVKTMREELLPLEANISIQDGSRHIILSARDATPLKLAEKSRNASESQYMSLFNGAPLGIYTINSDGKVLRANPTFVKMLGYSSFIEAVLVGLQRKNFDDNRFWSQALDPSGKGRELKWRRRDGSLISVREYIKTIRDENGAIVEYEGFAEDITSDKKSAETLAEVEERYGEFAESAEELMLETTLDGTVLYAGGKLGNILGYNASELVGRSVFDKIHEDDCPSLRAELERSALSRSAGRTEVRFKRNDGSVKWFESVCKARPTANGGFKAFIVSRDISERKKSERKNRYDTVVKSITNIIQNVPKLEDALELVADRIKNNIDNADSLSIWRINKDEALLRLHRGLPEWFVEKMKKIQSPKGFIWRTIADGKTSYSPDTERDILISPEGKELGTKSYVSVPVKFQGRVADIINLNSYKKNAFGDDELNLLETIAEAIESSLVKESVREVEERYRTLSECSTNLICELNSNGDYLYASPAYKHTLDYDPHELIGENILEMVHLDDFPTLIWEIKNGFQTNSGHLLFRYKHRNGHWRWFENRATKLRTADGEVRFLIVSEDTTEKKRMEKEVIKVQKLESLGILAGGIAHDFNNLLTAIWGNISLAKMGASGNDKLHKRLSEAEKGCIRAKDLTEQLLTFSKGGVPIKKTTSLGEMITESASFAIRGSNVRCEFNIAEELWIAEVDEGQISQVINNLTINADQAMPEGGVISITAENINVDESEKIPVKEGRYVKITIQDSGMGIPEEYLPKIFDPYFTTKQKGNGLGLATVNSVIKNHDGYIRVESKLRAGTRFYVYLPASEREIAKYKAADKTPVSGKGKILVMDDEDIVRDTVSAILTNLGYDLEGATDGIKAIDLYKRAKAGDKPFDLVIMDLTVPGGMGGRETMRRLLEFDPEVKAIVSSGYHEDSVMADHKGFGFKAVVGKPYAIEELSKTVYEVINDKGAKATV